MATERPRKMLLFLRNLWADSCFHHVSSIMKLSILLLLILSIGCGIAQEKGRNKKGSKRSGGGRDHQASFFHHFDSDKDGKVIRAEFDAGERIKNLSQEVRDKLFGRLDKDKDGVITKKEMKPPSGERSPDFENMRRFLKEADANQNGKITAEEFAAHPRFAEMPEKRSKNVFEMIDRNHDGVITRGDHRRPGDERNMVKDFDLDKSGALSWAEFKNIPHVMAMEEKEGRRRFEKLDSDNNGELSKEEVTKAGPPQRPRRDGPSRPKK